MDDFYSSRPAAGARNDDDDFFAGGPSGTASTSFYDSSAGELVFSHTSFFLSLLAQPLLRRVAAVVAVRPIRLTRQRWTLTPKTTGTQTTFSLAASGVLLAAAAGEEGELLPRCRDAAKGTTDTSGKWAFGGTCLTLTPK